MNKPTWNQERIRNKTLLIVEGNHEKEKLLKTILKAFPEIKISAENILIYQTNIYQLLNQIIKEYGDDWYEQDIDLPFLISQQKGVIPKETKLNYTDIFLIFDYERHDPNFSETGILQMQNYFSNSEDVGKLYINYPMVESYMDLKSIEDNDYIDKKTTSNIQNGQRYKNSVKDSFIAKLINFPLKIEDILIKNFHLQKTVVDTYVEDLLTLNNLELIEYKAYNYLKNFVEEKDLKTFVCQLLHIIQELQYIPHYTYNAYMRYIFKYIVLSNIKKAHNIQFSIYSNDEKALKQDFYEIDESNILGKQNIISSLTGKAEIYVLNTSVLLIPNYNTNLIFK